MPVLWKGKWDFYQGLTEVIKGARLKEYAGRARENKSTENCDTRGNL